MNQGSHETATGVRVAIGAAIALLTVGFLTYALAQVQTRPQKAPNPHWKANGCVECHDPAQGAPRRIGTAEADAICLKCHDGQRASLEFHPVGRAFDDKRYVRPKGWPLADDRLACLSCHDMLPGCSEKARRPAGNPMLLREYSASRAQSKPFCRNCHQAEGYQKLNPHLMLLSEKNEVIEDKCLFCHDQPLDRKTMARSGNARLKGDEIAMCRDCHPEHKDSMMTGHLQYRIGQNMQAVMAAREVIGLGANISGAMIDRIKANGTKPTLMVPGPGGTMRCSTCHNPHQGGVFPPGSVLAFRAMKLTDDNRLISPVHNKNWCRHCHDF